MTTTPNPTVEKVIADAITAYWADEERSGPNRGPEAHDRECGIDAAKALRAHGLLSEGAPSIDPASVREAIGEVLADMGALIEDMPVASDLHALTEIADAAVKAATSSPSRTAVPYTTVATAEGEHSQAIRARLLSEGAPSEETQTALLAAEAWAIRNAFIDFWGAHSSRDISAVGHEPKMPDTPILDAWYPRDGRDGIAAGVAPQERPGLDPKKVAEVLLQSEHAPMSDHDPRDGSCRSCPWPLHMLSPDEIARALCEAYTEGKLTK